MKLPNIAGLLGVGKAFVVANRPEILFGASVVSTVGAVVAAACGGYKSGQQVLLQELGTDLDARLDANLMTTKEKAQLTWMNYLPAAGLAASAVGSTTGLHLVHVKEKKQLAAAAIMAVDQVKNEAKKYEKALHDAGFTVKTDEESLEAAADEKGVARVYNSDGEIEEIYLVRDSKTQRDIWSNTARIDDAVLRCNELLMSEGSCDLDTFYSFAGFSTIPEGGHTGWSGEKIAVRWSNAVRDDGRPVREFTFRPAPKLGRPELS